MNLSRRTLLKVAVGMPTAGWLLNYRAIAAPHTGQVKITKIKTMGLDNVGDGCLIRIETDAGIVGYGEAGLPSAAARARIQMLAPQLIGQDPLSIERHFYMMAATQYSFMANIPTVSGVDIALWDVAGKITGYPVYRLLGGPFRKNIPVYSHGGPADMLDKAQCKAWADQVKSAPEGFTAFKFGFGPRGCRRAWRSRRSGGGGGGRARVHSIRHSMARNCGSREGLCEPAGSARRRHRHRDYIAPVSSIRPVRSGYARPSSR